MDDRVHLALAIRAANAQAQKLMHPDYRVKLPYHDFLVTEKHKLIPYVYAGVVRKRDDVGKPEASTLNLNK